tara:strand:+ start:1038 stop:3932 length:2895 start_codon:yes stop_codon:yes gene_type:complete
MIDFRHISGADDDGTTTPNSTLWLRRLDQDAVTTVDGLVLVSTYKTDGRPPEEVAILEKARAYDAHAVFFEAGRHGRPSVAQAFIFLSTGPPDDDAFAELHKRLWSWGGVPLLYRKTPGLVQLFRCAHGPDFVSSDGGLVCNPIETLILASKIASTEAWWDAGQLRNGTLWDDPAVCTRMLSSEKSAHRQLIKAIRGLNNDLASKDLLGPDLRRRLLILSLLIAYLEERSVLLPDFFAQYLPGASRFFEVLGNGPALVQMLRDLEARFNGHVFSLSDGERSELAGTDQLDRFAKLVEGHEEANGQLTFWKLYSFRDLPVELISHIYQLFVVNTDSSIYTPPALVRLVLEETLSWPVLDRLIERDEVILDPACGSGVFLVESFKRLVLHWRNRHHWKRPNDQDLRGLLQHVHGVDLDQGAVELAAFSLCLALCDALEPEDIRSSVNLFPILDGHTVHHSCFFEAKEDNLLPERIGVIVGNPPFDSKLTTPGAERSFARYKREYGAVPDKQLAYLFLHESMEALSEGGVLSMLQQYGFLYNHLTTKFRDRFFATWDVRQIFDFISIRGLFGKGGADTKVVVITAIAGRPSATTKILHAVFRRNGRANADLGFDIDYYDLHWIPRSMLGDGPSPWRANLFGGGRVYDLVKRLNGYPTLAEHAKKLGWIFGEGFIDGARQISKPAEHIIGKPVFPPVALSDNRIDETRFTDVAEKPIEAPRTKAQFTPPYLAVRKHQSLAHAVWSGKYLTFRSEIFGFADPSGETDDLDRVAAYLGEETIGLKAYTAITSIRMISRKATSLSGADIKAIPFPKSRTLDLSDNENILAEDIVKFQSDLIRLGDDATVLREHAGDGLAAYAECYMRQVNTVYNSTPLVALPHQFWPGVICFPFCFGEGSIEWTGADLLNDRLDQLLKDQRSETLSITRMARIYDDRFIFILKPDRLRYWLRSVALRDADETLADLREQGF